MKSTNVTQNLFCAPPLTHGSHCRTYHCEIKESTPQKPGRLCRIVWTFLKKKHVTLRHYPNVTRGTGFAHILYENIRFCFLKRMYN